MKRILLLLLLVLPTLSLAALPDVPLPTDLIGTSLEKAIASVMADLQNMAFRILFGLSLLQLVITGYAQLQSGEIDASIGKYARSFIWISFCVWLLSPSGDAANLTNGGHFIRAVINQFLALAGSWTALQNSSFDSGDILLTGLAAYGKITLAVLKATSTNVANALVSLFVPGVSFLTALMVFFISAVVMISCVYIALKVFMVKLEVSLTIAMGVLSMSFLGLNALRDQGMAPFKSMLALVYRIVLLGAIVASIGTVGDFLANYVDGLSYGLAADVFSPLIAAAFGFVLLAFLAHKSDSIATSLANGSAALGTSDMTGAVAAGVAVGMAAATGGAGAAGLASKGGQSMGDFIKSLTGGGSFKNESPTGTGGASGLAGDAPPPLPKAPEMSLKQMQEHPSNIANQGSNGSAPSSRSGPSASAPASPSSMSERRANMGMAESTSPGASSGESSPASGSGSNAGIGGAGGATDEKLDKLIESMGQSKKPSFGDRLGELNSHVAKEQAATHVSINTNAGD